MRKGDVIRRLGETHLYIPTPPNLPYVRCRVITRGGNQCLQQAGTDGWCPSHRKVKDAQGKGRA